MLSASSFKSGAFQNVATLFPSPCHPEPVACHPEPVEGRREHARGEAIKKSDISKCTFQIYSQHLMQFTYYIYTQKTT